MKASLMFQFPTLATKVAATKVSEQYRETSEFISQHRSPLQLHLYTKEQVL